MSAKMRGILVLMAALVCFALLFSCFFMAYEAGHVCCQERCAICCLVSAYQNLQRTLSVLLIVLSLVMGADCVLWFLRSDAKLLFVCPTPVANKVKLSN